MAKKFIIPTIFAVIILAVLVIFLGYYIKTRYDQPSGFTFSPPLQNVEFSNEQTQYPADWPDELKFPQEFILVDFASGSLLDSKTQGWGTKLRYAGKPKDARAAIDSLLKDKGWKLVESDKTDSGGFMLLIEDIPGSGVIIIDPDQSNPQETLIMTTIYPEQ